MKRLLLLLLLLGLPALAQGPRINVMVNGQPVAFDQPPIMVDARVLVPLRGVFQQMGATVVYNPANRSINAQKGATSISLAIGQRTAYVGGQPRQLDTPPILVGGRALVPLRFLSQALGARVDWHPDRWLVTVDSVVAQPQPPPPQSYGPLIQRVELSTGGPLVPGQTLHVRMLGAPGGQAHFDVGENRDLPMVEESPGRYEGSYTARLEDHERDARVVCHLHLAGQQARQEGPWRLAIGPGRGTWHQTQGGWQPPHAGGLIQNVTHNGTAPLYPGQILEVTMTGVPGGQATFGVGYVRNIPMRQVAPGTYVGSWTVPAGPRNPSVPVVVRLRLPGGEQQDRRGPNVNLMGGP